ncbi:hypothetical protein MG1601_75 [Mycoplasmoides gallisepticum]
MKKAYLLLSALALPLTSFQGGFSYKDTVNEFKLANHNSNNSMVSLTTRSSPVNLTFTLNPDRSKNTVESIKEQIVNLADQQFQKYFREVQSWIDEFKEEFRQLYQIDSVEYVESRLYNIDHDNRSFQDILDNSWFVRSNDERTDRSRSAFGEINNFGTYSDSNSANYDFAGKYNPTFKSYVEIIHNYSRVTKQIEIPKYDVKSYL